LVFSENLVLLCVRDGSGALFLVPAFEPRLKKSGSGLPDLVSAFSAETRSRPNKNAVLDKKQFRKKI
jgi:hypothetical protein